MKVMENENESMSLRDLGKGIAVRAGILGIAGAVVFAWVFTLAARAASGLVRIFTGLLLLSIAAGVGTWKVRQLRRHFGEDPVQ